MLNNRIRSYLMAGGTMMALQNATGHTHRTIYDAYLGLSNPRPKTTRKIQGALSLAGF